MVRTGEVWRDPESGASLTVVRAPQDGDGRTAVYERLLPEGSGRADPHVHLDFDQVYEVLEGRARYRLGRRWQVAVPGERIEVLRGVKHVDPYSDGGGPLRWRMTLTPAVLPFADMYAATLGRAMTEGRLNRELDLPKLTILAIAWRSGADSWDARAPVALQRLLVPLLGRLAEATGHHVATE